MGVWLCLCLGFPVVVLVVQPAECRDSCRLLRHPTGLTHTCTALSKLQVAVLP